MGDFKVPSLPVTNSITSCSQAAKEQNQPPENKNIETTCLCPYKIPSWSIKPDEQFQYNFEVLKSGCIIDEIKNLQEKPYWKFGRLPENDIEMAHPTISRFHAILQYKPKTNKQQMEEIHENTDEESIPAGWYIYDLGSTHGTFLNKQRLPPKVFIRIRVGHMLRLGTSTRSYILQGPTEDEDPGSELTITEIREQHKKKIEEALAEAQRKSEEAEERDRNEGISWGMAEDADEETDLTHNPYASTNNEELFLDDPKRTLRGFFEREGLTLEYKCDELSTGSFICRVELPIDDINGRPIVAEISHKGRKKDCVVQCALEACRILDRQGVLRQANQEPLKRKKMSKESDSDDDEFWDRTGDIERKKQRKSNTDVEVTLTYEDLLKQETELTQLVEKNQVEIAQHQAQQDRLKTAKAQQELESADLDSFMENLEVDAIHLDRTEIRKLRMEQQRLKTEQMKLQRLIKIAKPTELPFFAVTDSSDIKSKTDTKKRQLPLIGKRNQFSKFKIVKPINIASKNQQKIKYLASDEEEIEEDEETNINKKRPESHPIVEKTTRAIDEKQKTVTEINDNQTITVEENVLEIDCNLNSSTFVSNDVPIKLPEQNDILEDTREIDEINRKRQRQRQRNRNKRQEVDVEELEAHETSEKYSKWVPPENQSGDGYTKLNEKYGY